MLRIQERWQASEHRWTHAHHHIDLYHAAHSGAHSCATEVAAAVVGGAAARLGIGDVLSEQTVAPLGKLCLASP